MFLCLHDSLYGIVYCKSDEHFYYRQKIDDVGIHSIVNHIFLYLSDYKKAIYVTFKYEIHNSVLFYVCKYYNRSVSDISRSGSNGASSSLCFIVFFQGNDEILTIISTIIIVYGGYYYGLCDANMVLLTEKNLQGYLSEGRFILTKINPNPQFSLFLFFVVPRCFIYLTFIMVGQSLFNIVRGSLEKARLTAELEKAKEEAENASRAKTQFLAKMSHEIRTPVNAIMGMNEMILRESKDASIRNYAGDVKHSSEELLSIINEILDSSKIESGRMEIVCADYDLNP